jgi:hypothetical protein
MIECWKTYRTGHHKEDDEEVLKMENKYQVEEKVLSSGLQRNVVQGNPDVSEEYITSIFRMEG